MADHSEFDGENENACTLLVKKRPVQIAVILMIVLHRIRIRRILRPKSLLIKRVFLRVVLTQKNSLKTNEFSYQVCLAKMHLSIL